MIPTHAYTAMLVTGSLHCVLGVAAFITPIVGVTLAPVTRTFHAVAILPGIWMLLVGCLGIAAGIQKLQDNKIRQLKIAYMVTAILSASVLCLLGWWMYSAVLVTDVVLGAMRYVFTEEKVDLNNVWIVARIGLTLISLEFILAIVSSSICCCCSPTNEVPGVIIQPVPPQIITTVPGNTTIMYQQPYNGGMQYQSFQTNTMGYQPPAYQVAAKPNPTQPK